MDYSLYMNFLVYCHLLILGLHYLLKGLIFLILGACSIKKNEQWSVIWGILIMLDGPFHFGMTGLVPRICMSSVENIFIQTQRPAKKYYLHYAHYKAIIEEAERIHNNYIDLTCDCPVCNKGFAAARRLLSQRLCFSDVNVSEAIFISNMKARDRDIHFMYSRKEEANLIINKSLDTSIRELNHIIDLSKKRKDFLLNRDLLRKWIEAL